MIGFGHKRGLGGSRLRAASPAQKDESRRFAVWNRKTPSRRLRFMGFRFQVEHYQIGPQPLRKRYSLIARRRFVNLMPAQFQRGTEDRARLGRWIDDQDSGTVCHGNSIR